MGRANISQLYENYSWTIENPITEKKNSLGKGFTGDPPPTLLKSVRFEYILSTHYHNIHKEVRLGVWSIRPLSAPGFTGDPPLTRLKSVRFEYILSTHYCNFYKEVRLGV